MVMREGIIFFMEKVKNEKAFDLETDLESLALGVSFKYWGTVVRRLLEKCEGT